MEQWNSVFRDSKNQRTRNFLDSHGINTFASLRRSIIQLEQAARPDQSALDGWVAVVKTFRHVNYLDEDGNQQCQDIAESICQSLSTRRSIGEKNQAKFYFEWAKLESHRENEAESFAHIAQARRLDTGNFRYDLWYANTLNATQPLQSQEAIAIYKAVLAKLEECR